MTMKQKIIIALMIALSMMTVVLAGCGSKRAVDLTRESDVSIEMSTEASDNIMTDSLSGTSSIYNDDEYISPEAYSEEEGAEINGETFNGMGDEEELTDEDIEKMLEGLSDEELAEAAATGEIPKHAIESKELTTEEALASTEESKDISGIIVMRRLVTNTQALFIISAVNPDTGASHDISQFDVAHINGEENYTTDYYSIPGRYKDFVTSSTDFTSANHREWFSSDYSKLALTKTFGETGEQHVGWINADGNFFDLTEALNEGMQSEFDNPKGYLALGFLPDDSFVYVEIDHGEWTYHRTSADYSSSDVGDQTFRDYYLVDDHTLNTNRDHMWVNHLVSDWIDDQHYIGNSKYFTHYETDKTCFIVDTETHEKVSFIPGDSRLNWSGVLSPNSDKVAFLSAPMGNTYIAPNVYVIPIEGGDPVKVECGNDYFQTIVLNSLKSNYFLLDWL
ncbi:MAG: hypothetical protein NC429_08170 [Lachnospiraceae bacterium]|nr:hypothetical protein [Lachnospiraceae bacterium]